MIWFVVVVVFTLIGGMLGHADGGMIGFFLGTVVAIIGAAFSSGKKSNDEPLNALGVRLARAEHAIKELTERLQHLEKRADQGEIAAYQAAREARKTVAERGADLPVAADTRAATSAIQTNAPAKPEVVRVDELMSAARAGTPAVEPQAAAPEVAALEALASAPAATPELAPTPTATQVPAKKPEPAVTPPVEAPVLATPTPAVSMAASASAAVKTTPAAQSAKNAWEPATAPPRPAKPHIPSPPSPPTPPVKREPGFFETWLTRGNVVVLVGAAILFIGVGFLVKFAAEQGMFPLELRLALIAAGAIALLVTGWVLRKREGGYGLVLQGAGVGLLYLTTFGAYHLWHVLPPGFTFVTLAAVAVLAAILAVRQDAMVLAVTGATGGFLAPILASSGGGSHVALFSYYALLNAGIFFIAWHKAWRALNLLGFVFTFAIGLVWGQRFYQPEFFATTEPFLILFFLAYVAVAILYARRQAPQLNHYVDGTLIFGVPLVGFGLQAALVKDMESGLALSSLALAAFYLILARWLYTRRRDELRLLVESFLALGVIFATLTLPLELDARWTSASWAVEGAGVYWIGLRQQRKLARAFGLLLQVFAALAFVRGWDRSLATHPLANPQFIGALMMAAAGMALHRLMRREDSSRSALEASLAPLIFLWCLAWWLFAGLSDIEHFVPHAWLRHGYLLFFLVTAGAFSIAAVVGKWLEATWPFQLLLPVFIVLSFAGLITGSDFFENGGWLIWPVAIAAYFAMMRAHSPTLEGSWGQAIRAGTGILLAAMGAMAAVALLSGDHRAADELPIRNAQCIGSLLMSACGLVLHLLMRKAKSDAAGGGDGVSDQNVIDREFAPLLFGWSLFWWLLAGVAEIHHFAPHQYELPAVLGFLTATAAISGAASLLWNWQEGAWPMRGMLPVMIVMPILALVHRAHPFANYGWLVWPIAVTIYLGLLRSQERHLSPAWLQALKTGTGLFLLEMPCITLIVLTMFWQRPAEETALMNPEFAGAFSLAVLGLITHWRMRRAAASETSEAEEGEDGVVGINKGFAAPVFAWSLFWWLVGGLGEIRQFVDHDYEPAAILAFLAGTVIVSSVASVRWRWTEGAWPYRGLLVSMVGLAVLALERGSHPFANYGWAVWPIALAWQIALLRAHEGGLPAFMQRALHLGTVYFLAILGGWEMYWLTREFDLPHSAWSAASVVLPCIVLAALICSRAAGRRWPVQMHREMYLLQGVTPLLVALIVWSVAVNLTQGGQSQPLPYLPLLNAIDITHALIILVIFQWRSRCVEHEQSADPLGEYGVRLMLGGVLFFWMNAVLLRTIHNWADVPYQFAALMKSVLVQTSLSIFWTLVALTLMLIGTRRVRRGAWVLGALLMAVVVVKLMLIDLSNSGSLMRIVSFIGVGVLMLVIGYVAPVPPAERQEEAA